MAGTRTLPSAPTTPWAPWSGAEIPHEGHLLSPCFAVARDLPSAMAESTSSWSAPRPDYLMGARSGAASMPAATLPRTQVAGSPFLHCHRQCCTAATGELGGRRDAL
ncbi:hypothetical protein CFC21_096144 [Triticum aestivum]|uniref:Uncharacterized protein n=3 Tax=Triticum TaxID=4564 RepID=A0A9R1BJ23_TRITD|nr:hypothetical protein CFC21_096144 [Triticum aestivum]VAI70457.1 unnamed protein product [Triticum turgidum subsp. durum]